MKNATETEIYKNIFRNLMRRKSQRVAVSDRVASVGNSRRSDLDGEAEGRSVLRAPGGL